MVKTLVVALGGNAIKKAGEWGTAEEQLKNVGKTCGHILKIINRGYRVVLTHGNGPQAGNLMIQQEEAKNLISPQPLDVVGAMTEGQIGYMLQKTLTNCLGMESAPPVITVLTQVLVNKDDIAFRNPSKPVGPFYSKEEAHKLTREKGYTIKKVMPIGEKPYRRVVPSPDPVSIVEKKIIRDLVDSGAVVIACGGGGIPVIKREDGTLEGVEAVVDKDLAGERLGVVVGADTFLILTDVEKVKLNYGKTNEKDLDSMSVVEAKQYLKEGQFPEGSMKSKILSCIRFLESGGHEAIITSLEMASEALDGKTGTRIFRN